MIRTVFNKLIFAALICIFSISVNAQSDGKSSEKKYKFSLYAGVGPNYYFNNLVLGKNYVNEVNYSFVGRLMWEPEHNLSLGIESGYNRLYTMDVEVGAAKIGTHIVNVAIPIQIVVAMKFFENFYASFSLGQSILKNQVSTTGYGDFNASSLSLGDFGATIGYKRLVGKRIFLGSEVKGYYSSKLEDKNISLIFLSGFRF